MFENIFQIGSILHTGGWGVIVSRSVLRLKAECCNISNQHAMLVTDMTRLASFSPEKAPHLLILMKTYIHTHTDTLTDKHNKMS